MQVVDSVLSVGLSGKFTAIHYIIMVYNLHRAATFELVYIYYHTQALLAYNIFYQLQNILKYNYTLLKMSIVIYVFVLCLVYCH